MSFLKVSYVIPFAGLLLCLASATRGDDRSAGPRPTAPSGPALPVAQSVPPVGAQPTPLDWRTMPAHPVSTTEAAPILEVCRRCCDLANAGDRERCLRLFSTTESKKHWVRELDHLRATNVVLECDEEAQVVSPLYLRVRLWVAKRGGQPVTAYGIRTGIPLRLYLGRSDPQRLLSVNGVGVFKGGSLPVDPIDLLKPLPKDPNLPAGSHLTMAQIRAGILGFFAPEWANANGDQEARWESVQAWWDGQTKAYGEYSERLNTPTYGARFVGMSGDSAVVERDLYFGNPQKDMYRVTYRFRLVQAPNNQDRSEGGYHFAWRIAEVSVYKSERVTIAPGPARAGGGAGGPSPASSAPAAPFATEAH